MRVRVGIVSYNTADLLDRCLAAVPAAFDGLDAIVDVVVVDNASTDGSADVAARHANVTVIRNEGNVGYARAMNVALDGAADVLVAINPDCDPPPGSLAACARELLADTRVGLVAPRLLHADGSHQPSAYRFPAARVPLVLGLLPERVVRRGIGRRLWLEGHHPHDVDVDIDWAIGAVHVLRPAAVAEAGDRPYDERWFMYVEDLDLCWRMAACGWRRRLLGTVVVPHVGNAAGASAFGGGRTARWQWATYDWLRLRKGPVAPRAVAAANLVAVASLLVRAAVLPSQRPRLPYRRANYAPLLRLHARALVRGAAAGREVWSLPP